MMKTNYERDMEDTLRKLALIFGTSLNPPDIEELIVAAIEARRDTERLQFLEDETMRGHAPNLVFDDDGNWAVSGNGFQPVPRGDGKGFDEPVAITCCVEPGEWRPSVRAALDAAMKEASSQTTTPNV